MIFDPNKNMVIKLNYLNLPVQYIQGNTRLTIIYDATGLKLGTALFVGDQKVDSTYYVNGLEYEADTLIIHHIDGIVKKHPDNTVEYYYYIKNYRNDVVFLFRDANGDGIISMSEREEHHYYPYGMEIDGIWMKTKEKNSYLFGMKEHDDFSGMDDFGARFLDASIPYWGQVDPLASLMPAWSPYSYGANNPILNIDPDGRRIETIYVNRRTREEVEVDDGVDKVIVVNDSDFNEAKEFAFLINGQLKKNGEVDFRIVAEYEEFFAEHNNYSDVSIGSMYDYFFERPDIPVDLITGTVPEIGPGKFYKAGKFIMELPALDRTRKVHGVLPKIKNLVKYSKEELKYLLYELKISVQQRIRVTARKGRDRPHGQRQGAEQDLIKSIEKYLNIKR